MRWEAGSCGLATSSTGTATLMPSAAAVQTSIPGSISVTRTSPFGVEMKVAAARQIGQFGALVGERELTLTMPSTRTAPVTTRYDALLLVDCTPEETEQPPPWPWSGCSALSSFHALISTGVVW